MSIKEQSINTKKVIIASNESSNKKEEVPIKTSQSMNTESYEYFSQKITTKNNLTESSLQTSIKMPKINYFNVHVLKICLNKKMILNVYVIKELHYNNALVVKEYKD